MIFSKQLALICLYFNLSYTYKPIMNFSLDRKTFVFGLGVLAINKVNALQGYYVSNEYKRLINEANKLKAIFDEHKKNINKLPKLSFELKPTKTLEPEYILTYIIKKLESKNEEIKNEGIKTIYNFLSNTNMFKNKPFVFFNNMLKNTKYNILLGNFETYNINKIELNDKNAIYDVKLYTNYKQMLINNIQDDDGIIYIRCLFSKDNNDFWLLDGMFINEMK